MRLREEPNISSLIHTFQLMHFVDGDPPPYAILSHTWEDDEVTRPANEDGLQWAWVDICCIDKTSSAELSETINSMFRYYREAFACYAYLRNPRERTLWNARWFTRGWTLQELIAPFDVTFYDKNWVQIGAKSQMTTHLEEVTGIPEDILMHKMRLQDVSVYRRMKWAAWRNTTRIEDAAYCLLGIFDIAIPLLYGEGKMAFARLQEAIITRYQDQSLLAWGTVNGDIPTNYVKV
ncbi:hypothetical protein B0T16DRAFT_510501 [Cercophora newfieldiana]|uniref:Heterokaryon incompatibility domain-containing protein n=1 Tax=Cercophora newfieldiana TaxID=92897 RepID=A0AA39Y5E5_9PEZI|nr:hypothetical protein B0T16DRAFT_510501 [Cercophora newfieldiana]